MTTTNTESVSVYRDIPEVGRLEFSQSTDRNGRERREYWLLPEGGQRRSRLPSVTTILRDTWPKPNLLEWYAREPNASAILANASHRGKNVHRFVETFLTTGDLLDFADFPQDHRGFLRGAAQFLWEYDPEPLAVERLICHPELRYAGRLDLIARLADAPDLVTLVDFKSNPKGNVYREAHVQCEGYRIADERCGGQHIDRVLIVGLSEEGDVNVVTSNTDAAAVVWTAALEWHGHLKRLEKALA
jgi:hypothetical protein